MINLTEDIRNQKGLLSREGMEYTFLHPDAYAAASLQDFLEDRGSINSSWRSRMKINYVNSLVASVVIKSCRYRPHELSLELPPQKKWKALEDEIYANELIRSIKEGTTANLKQAEIEFLNRFKNGELYDAASRYLIIARIPVPPGITIYNVWLKYVPSSDLAEIDSFDEHDNIKVSDKYAHSQRIGNFLPALRPA